jgi:hypothetical protein
MLCTGDWIDPQSTYIAHARTKLIDQEQLHVTMHGLRHTYCVFRYNVAQLEYYCEKEMKGNVVMFALEQAMKVQRGSTLIALLFL